MRTEVLPDVRGLPSGGQVHCPKRNEEKDIAKAINVSPSTISREIKRNSGHTRPVHN